MITALRTADQLSSGMIIDHWVDDRTILGKAVEDIDRQGSRISVKYTDGTKRIVSRYIAAFVREPMLDAQKNFIVGLLHSKNGKKWRNVAGLDSIDKPHVPLGWVPMTWVEALRELVIEKRVSIVETQETAYLVEEGE